MGVEIDLEYMNSMKLSTYKRQIDFFPKALRKGPSKER